VQATSLPAVNVSDVKMSDNSISFTVDQVGVPVLVKASYFPNWEVSGAKGPYRVAPNSMVVIPTSNHVTLHYGHTPTEYFAYFLSLVGIAGLIYLWRKGRVDYGRPEAALGLPLPPGLDDSWTPPSPTEPITFLMDWDEDDRAWSPGSEPPPPPALPPPDGADHEASLPPPG
jgi:hypothetical protein